MLSPLFFAIGIHSSLQAAATCPSDAPVTILAYMDDIYIVGKAPNVQSALNRFRVSASGIGLSVNALKTQFYSPTASDAALHIDDAIIPSQSVGVNVLGAPVGSDNYCTQAISTFFESTRATIEAIATKASAQDRVLLPRQCYQTQPLHFYQTVPPALTTTLCANLEAEVRQYFRRLVELPDAFAQVFRPLCYGGFGFLDYLLVSHASFVSD